MLNIEISKHWETVYSRWHVSRFLLLFFAPTVSRSSIRSFARSLSVSVSRCGCVYLLVLWITLSAVRFSMKMPTDKQMRHQILLVSCFYSLQTCSFSWDVWEKLETAKNGTKYRAIVSHQLILADIVFSGCCRQRTHNTPVCVCLCVSLWLIHIKETIVFKQNHGSSETSNEKKTVN